MHWNAVLLVCFCGCMDTDACECLCASLEAIYIISAYCVHTTETVWGVWHYSALHLCCWWWPCLCLRFGIDVEWCRCVCVCWRFSFITVCSHSTITQQPANHNHKPDSRAIGNALDALEVCFWVCVRSSRCFSPSHLWQAGKGHRSHMCPVALKCFLPC